MAAASALPTDVIKAEAYIGSLISLITKSDIRYEGFLFQLNAQDSTIALRNVKSFGTEGRKQDGTSVAQSDRIYDYIYFRGSDIKDLQVVSSPPVQSTPTVPDDPAIIQSHNSHPPANITLVSPNALGGSSNAHFGVQVPQFQGNMTPLQSVEVSGSWAPLVPAAPVNINGPPMQSYWPGFTGLPGGNSHFQHQPFPPPPQGLLLANPIQQQLPHPSMNASLSGNALNFAELPRTLLPPVCAGSLNLISTVSPSSTAQYSHIPLSAIFSHLSSTPMSNNASIGFTTETVQSGPQMVYSLTTTSDINSVIPPVTDQAHSLLGPAPFPTISKSAFDTVGISSTCRGKTSIVPPATSGTFWQPRLTQPSSSDYLKPDNSDSSIILPSASNLPPSHSENVDGSAIQLPKSPTRKLHQGASSSHYGNRRHAPGRGDLTGGNMFYPYQNYRGRARGLGRGNMPYRPASHNYPTYRGHPVGRGSGMIGTASYARHINRGQGREYEPNAVTPYHHRNAWTPAWGGSQAVTTFSEDFDFEAMNEKFNKEEVWGLLGKKDQAEPEDEKGDEKEGDGIEADEARDGTPKLDHKHGYCKDDFFDSLSSTAFDGEPGREKMKFSDLRERDAETFGEFQMPQRGRGIQRPPRGGYRGRGYERGGRRRMRAVWSRVN